MSAFLVLLLLLSIPAATADILISRRRSLGTRYSPRQIGMATGAAQLVVGGLWALWGGLYLNMHGTGEAGGWYAVLIAALWAVQGLRRLAGSRRRPR